jgi:pimeloyl-ACP methyl ester carboxylesterase
MSCHSFLFAMQSLFATRQRQSIDNQMPNNQPSKFFVKEHVFQGQHLRQWYSALSDDQNYAVKIHAKQYIPAWNVFPQPGDITFVALHANAMWKELYEPLWEDFFAEAERTGLRVRSIWMADIAGQGESGVSNADHLGTEYNWFDHSRDILAMVNQFREDMPRPLVGLGHSMGGSQLIYLSTIHPRLFEGIALIEPYLLIRQKPSPEFMRMTHRLPLRRRDLWDSEAEALADVDKHHLLKGWDPRALTIYKQTALARTPTALYPDEHGKWTLRTTKYSELHLVTRPNLHSRMGAFEEKPMPLAQEHSDLNVDTDMVSPFYNSAARLAFDQLARLRPKVLFVRGKSSPMVSQVMLDQAILRTGTGVGGSGGRRLGHVDTAELKGGHLITMTAPSELTKVLCQWSLKIHSHVMSEDKAWISSIQGRSAIEQHGVPDDVRQIMLSWDGHAWPNSDLPKL